MFLRASLNVIRVAVKLPRTSSLIWSAAIRRCSSDSTELHSTSVKRIRLVKRLFAASLFGFTLVSAWFARRSKRKEWAEVLLETRRLQGQKFGELELFEFRHFILAEPVIKIWKEIERFKFRDSDILLVSYPKTGTTWLQEIIWLLVHKLDYDTALAKSISDRFPYLEFPSPGIKSIERRLNPRLIKTHLSPNLILSATKSQSEKPKVIAILRNPKDVAVSYYHFSRMNNLIGFKGDFNEFFNRFVDNKVPYGPIWDHYSDAVKLLEEDRETPSDSKRVLIVFYEDLIREFPSQIDKICEFLNVPRLSDDEMKGLAKHTSFAEMQQNPAVNYQHWDDLGFRKKSEAPFMRKGTIGDWRNYFSNEQDKILTELTTEKLGDKLTFVYD